MLLDAIGSDSCRAGTVANRRRTADGGARDDETCHDLAGSLHTTIPHRISSRSFLPSFHSSYHISLVNMAATNAGHGMLDNGWWSKFTCNPNDYDLGGPVGKSFASLATCRRIGRPIFLGSFPL